MAIHEEKYVAYDGPLKTGRAWWVLATTTFKQMIGFLRTKLVVLFLWIGPVIALVGTVAEYFIRSQGGGMGAPSGIFTSAFLQVQFYGLALLLLTSGCGVVSHDLRHNTFQLYFSQPVAKWEYGLGKFLSLMMLGSLVSVGPTVLVGGLRVVMLSGLGYGAFAAGQLALASVVSVGLTVLLAALVVGLSSLNARTGFVVLALIGVLFVPGVAGLIAGLAAENRDLGSLLSIQGNMHLAVETMITGESQSVPRWPPFVLLSGAVAAGIGMLQWRLRRV